MANIVQRNLVSEGPKDAILQIYLESDGSEGELTNYVILDPLVDFKNPLPIARDQYDSYNNILEVNRVAIMQAWVSNSWFDAFFQSESKDGPDTNYRSLILSRDCDFYMDYRYFGGIKDFTPRPQATGRLLISTKDFAPQGSKGFMVLHLRKYLE